MFNEQSFNVITFKRHWRNMFKPNERVLDIGGGKGFLIEFLQGKGMNLDVTAIDINAAKMKDRINDNCVHGDMLDLPFEDESFDRVFFFSSLHHTINTKRALEEAKRVVKRGGHIAFTEPISLRLLLKNKGIANVGGEEHAFSSWHLLRTFKQLGLKVVYIRYQGFFWRFFLKIASILELNNHKKIIIFFHVLTDRIDDVITKIPGLRLLGFLIKIVVLKEE